MMKHRIGTLKCILFGHKFMWQGAIPEKQIGLNYGEKITTTQKLDYCIFCGITRDELTKLNQEK